MTKGEYRVGKNFNPSGHELVERIKEVGAQFIDLVEQIPVPEDASIEQSGEIARLKALAQTDAEAAAMWGVKAATKRAPDDPSHR